VMHRLKVRSGNEADSTTTIVQEPSSDDRPGWHRSTHASTGGSGAPPHGETAAFRLPIFRVSLSSDEARLKYNTATRNASARSFGLACSQARRSQNQPSRFPIADLFKNRAGYEAKLPSRTWQFVDFSDLVNKL
jgi:hypothetical protein